MADFLVGFGFNQQGYAWTDSFYWAGGSGGLDKCLEDSRRFGQTLLGVMGVGVALEGISIRSLVPGSSQRTYMGPKETGIGSRPSTADERNFPWTGLLAQITDATKHWRRQWIIRGIPEADLSVVVGAGTPRKDAVAADIRNQLNAIFLLLTSGSLEGNKKPLGQWSLRVRGRPNPTLGGPVLPLVRTPIAGISSAGVGTNYDLIVSKGLGINQGDTVHIHRASGCAFKGLNGDTRVINVNTAAPLVDVLTVAKTNCCGALESYDSRATLYKVTYTLTKISDCVAQGTRIRKTGTTSFQTKGKGSKKCCK